jgi:hypothetical protein
VFAEIVAVATTPSGGFELAPADVLHDLTPVEGVALEPPELAVVRSAEDFVRMHVQQPKVVEKRAERLQQAEIRTRYLDGALDAERKRLELKWSELDDRVFRGESQATIARDSAHRRLEEVERRRTEKLAGFEQLGIVKPGPVAYLGSALVGPPAVDEQTASAMRSDPEVELAAMEWALDEERRAGWEPKDVSAAHDGSGFDIRSVRRDERGRVAEVRRIEVAAARHGEGYWLYVLYGAKSEQPRGVKIRNPHAALGAQVREVTQVTAFHVPGEAIEALA